MSDEATFTEMVEKIASSLAVWSEDTDNDDVPRSFIYRGAAEVALVAAGVPDLLAALRTKDAEIEEKAQQLHVLTTERDMSIRMEEALSVECARYREALEKLTTQGDPFLAGRIARSALYGPAVEEES